MAKFCTKCGNLIEYCTCQSAPVAPETAVSNQQNQQFYSNNNYTDMNNVGEQQSQNVQSYEKKPIVKIDLTNGFFEPIKNFFGFRESEMIDNTDPYESGKKIVPELVAPCEGEIPVKQYDIGKCRARLRLQWSEARMQVTNKRVLFRVSGRSVMGKDVSNYDYKIDEISGVNFAKGIQFSFLTYILGLFWLIFVTAIGVGLGCIPVLNIILDVAFFLATVVAPFAIPALLKRKLHIVCGSISSLTLGICAGGMIDGTDFHIMLGCVLGSICVIISLYQLIRFALKPSASIEIITKDAGKSVFGLYSGRIFTGTVGLDEIVPAKDTDDAFKEMSAIISDIQQLGNYGVEKWKE